MRTASAFAKAKAVYAPMDTREAREAREAREVREVREARMQANLGHVGGKGGLEGEGLNPVVATLMRRRQPLYWPPGRSYKPQPFARLIKCDATVKYVIWMQAV